VPYKPSNSGGSKKPKKPSGVSGFISNLVGDVSEAATSFIPGVAYIGSSIGHDIKDTFDGGGTNYRVDDILSAIGHSYTDRGTYWGEVGRSLGSLASGDVRDFLRHGKNARGAFYDHPLNPILDVATIFTGGGALAGKAGITAGTKAGQLSHVAAATGKGFDRKLSKNPAIALRQQGFDALTRRVSPEAPVIGGNARVARHMNRQAKRKMMREEAKALRPMREALRGLNRAERAAVAIRAGGHDLDAYEAFYAKREADLLAEIERKANDGPDPHDRMDGDEDLAAEDRDPSDLSGLLEADRAESLKRNRRNLGHVRKRLAEVRDVRASGVLDDAKSAARVERAVEAARGLSAHTTQRLIDRGMDSERGVQRLTLEGRLMQTAGVVDEAKLGAIRSHVRVGRDKVDSRGGSRTSHAKPGTLAESQRNTGYNFWNGRDRLDPAMFIHSSRQVFENMARHERFAALLDMAEQFPAGEVPAGWRVLDDNVRKDVAEVASILEDARPVLEGTPGFEELVELLNKSVPTHGGEAKMVNAVPEKFYRELVGEFEKSSAFVRVMIDKPTRVWRALVLNLKPSWLVNNYVGQMFLLAFAHGARGMKAYFQQFGAKGKVMDELAPELSDFSWARETLDDLAGNDGRVVGALKWLPERMGRLNQKLTDDHTRNAAFLATIEPHVKKYQKAHPGTSFEDAARALWENEDFADMVTQRVLDDMIDFTDMSDFERRAIKRAIPFYSWLRGISKRQARMLTDEPWKANVGAHIGQLGAEQVEERYGNVPLFMRSMIPTRYGDLVTAASNPFQTPADLLAMGASVFTSDRVATAQNPLSQLGPVPKPFLEALANKDFFSGRDVDSKFDDEDMSYAQRYGQQVKNLIPQLGVWNEYQQAKDAEQGGLEYEPLFDPNVRDKILAYLGLNLRHVNLDAAHERAAR
jgi:hypothetical protein